MLASRYVELCLILASFISLIMNSAASRQPVQINPVGFFSSQAYNLYGDPKADWVPDKRNSFAYIISPISRQLIEISRQSENKPQSELSATLDPVRDAPLLDLRNGSCSTVENKVMLERDELSSTTNQLIRTCRGYVKVKQCDGSCYSSVAPSALTHTGIKFDCSCCSENQFRPITVILEECYSPTSDGSLTRRDPGDPLSFMEVQVEEPIECQCRKCQNVDF